MSPADPLDLLGELVAIDSTNPGAGEAVIGQFIHHLATQWRFESQLVETAPGRMNVVARIDAGGTRSLGLNGHLDTKPVGDSLSEWCTPPCELVVDGDIAYGLGASDMKGAVAAKLVAARAWSESAELGRLDLILTAADSFQIRDPPCGRGR